MRKVLLIVALMLTATAHAGQLLREVIQHGAATGLQGETPELEVLLGTPMTLQSAFASRDDRTYTARMSAAAGGGDQWEFTELGFDEAGYDVRRVTVEGSPRDGFELTLHFERPVAVITLPQYANDRVAVKYLDRSEYRSLAARAGAAPSDSTRWAIELAPGPLLQLQQTPRALLLNRYLYITGQELESPIRLGFFTRDKARSVLSEVRGAFPAARVVAVTEEEARYGERLRLNSERVTALFSATSTEPGPASNPRISITTATTGALAAREPDAPSTLLPWKNDVDDSLLEQAKEAYIDGDFARAIALYTRAAEVPAFRLEALEMLGVTREQTRQLAQAKLAYETALAEFPERTEAARIRARLQALVSIDAEPRRLRQVSAAKPAAWQTSVLLSQFYRRYSVHVDRQDTIVPINGLFSDADLTVRRSTASSRHEGRVSLGHLLDLSDDAGTRDLRVQALYWESVLEPLNTGVRLGRQSQRGSGVLGRFDGVAVTHEATDTAEVQLLGGYLLDSSYDSLRQDRPFWGLNGEIVFLDDGLSVRPFYVQQRYDGIEDRRAVGLQSEFYTDRGTYLGLLDYDLHHQALNHVLISSNIRVGQRTRVYGSVDHRRSPYLTTRNALIGQPVEDLSELELLLVEDLVDASLDDIAADRSAVSTLVRAGVDRRFESGWAVSFDASFSDFSSTETSANVTGLDAHQDFYLSTQIRSENAFGQGNYGALMMRYFDSGDSRTTSAYFNNRLGLGEAWWLYPRLAVDHRQFGPVDQTQLRVKPSLRLDYRHYRRLRLELEVGYEWSTRDMPTGHLGMRGLFVLAGYRLTL